MLRIKILQKIRACINKSTSRTGRLNLIVVRPNNQSIVETFNRLSIGSVDLILVRNLVSPEPLQAIIRSLEEGERGIPFFSFGKGSSVFPLPYSMMSNRFFTDSEISCILSNLREQSDYLRWESFSVVSNLIFNQIKAMCGSLEPVAIGADQVELCPLNTRVFSHECEGTTIHSENSFLHNLFSPLQNALTKCVDGENALSFFCAIQTPDEGGELQLFTEKIPSRHEVERNDVADFRDSDEISAKSGIIIPIEAGDMVIFRGAKLFHQVMPVRDPNKVRVTIGGFIARNLNSENWGVWS